MKQTHYEILGVEVDADEATVRKAYRRLVLEVHPDRSTAPDAKERFIRVNQAYEVLLDPVRRASYNRVLLMDAVAQEAPAKEPERQTKPVAKPGQGDLIRLMQLVNKGLYIEAEKVAVKMRTTQPTEALPCAVLGDIARMRGKLRDAAAQYAFAIQLDPGNRTFERKHAEVTRVMFRQEPMGTIRHQHSGPAALVVAGFAILSCAVYVATSRDIALFRGFAPISTWTLGLVMGLFVSGVAAGASLTVSDNLDPSSYTGKIAPQLALGFVAIVNFWVAGLLFLLISRAKKIMNPGLAKLVGAVAGTTLIFMLAAYLAPSFLDVPQVALWGGNVVYLGALLGSQVAESFR